jgi:hypothetical protein
MLAIFQVTNRSFCQIIIPVIIVSFIACQKVKTQPAASVCNLNSLIGCIQTAASVNIQLSHYLAEAHQAEAACHSVIRNSVQISGGPLIRSLTSLLIQFVLILSIQPFVSFSLAFAKDEKSPVSHVDSHEYEGRLLPGTNIEFTSYDKESNTFKVVWADYPNMGKTQLFATPESVVKAITSLNLKIIKAKPNSILGTIYSVDKDLVLIAPNVVRDDPKFATVRLKLKSE